jgi:methylmalonyl-CoA/ethylmalonyl-CoA epimerase
MLFGSSFLYFCRMNKIEHIGIAVRNLEKSSQLFELLLNNPPYKQEDVASEGVTTLFFNLGESKIELLQSHREDGTIGKFIEKKGEGFHHIAIGVKDIDFEMNRLREAGFELLNDVPKAGADNKLICFLHPKSTGGILVELCQDKPTESF